jgi:hypothetical protein
MTADKLNTDQEPGNRVTAIQKTRILPGGLSVNLNIYVGDALAEFLNHPAEFDQFLLLHQQVFGEDPWNEGGFCPQCGFSLPLCDFEALGANPVCPQCKTAALQPFYPLDKMRLRITAEFSRQRGDMPFLLLPKIDETVVGFIWGTVAPLSVIKEHCLEAYYLDIEKPKGQQSFDAVRQAYLDRGWSLERVASIDGFVLTPSQRESGLYALLEQELVKTLLKIGCHSVLIATAHMSKMYSILMNRFPGFELLHRQDETIIFVGMSAL